MVVDIGKYYIIIVRSLPIELTILRVTVCVNLSEEIIMSAIWLATIENTHMARYGSDEYVPFWQTTNAW